MNNDFFDHLSLPMDNTNEQLENRSRTAFLTALDPAYFEPRDEHQRDKGIDMTVEIKHKGRYTGFRFAIQLKSTATRTKNKDGSISYDIDMSNLNYLMNQGIPANYVLFDAQELKLYYLNAAQLFQQVEKKYNSQDLPKTISARFYEILDTAALMDIHAQTLEKGITLRNLGKYLHLDLQKGEKSSTLIIDPNKNIYRPEERMALINDYGQMLLAEGKYELITEIEKGCLPLTEGSSKFHFVCGSAHYHRSTMFQALIHYKKAKATQQTLPPEIQSMLTYYTQMTKYSLGMIAKSEVEAAIDSLMHSQYLGLFLKIEKAYHDYHSSNETEKNYKTFTSRITEISQDPHFDENLWIVAESYSILVDSMVLNNLTYQRLLIEKSGMAFLDPDRESDEAWTARIVNYNIRVQALHERAEHSGKPHNINVVSLNNIKASYTNMCIGAVIEGYQEESGEIILSLSEEVIKKIKAQADYLQQIADSYGSLFAMENQVVALSLKYELLLFIGLYQETKEVLAETKRIIDDNDLVSLKTKLTFLQDRGATHELLGATFQETMRPMREERLESERINELLHQMDKEDFLIETHDSERDSQIETIPFGLINFKTSALNEVLSAMNVIESIRPVFSSMISKKIVPRVSLYNNPVKEEGFANGQADYKGLETNQNFYQVRLALRNIGGHRIIPKNWR